MKRQPAPKPFEEYYAYPPIFHKRENRYMVVLIPKDPSSGLKRTSTSHARYKMAIRLGRQLRRSEHVDHIDGDPSNDEDNNLQILTPAQNNQKEVRQKNSTG